jgi:hypothetical protein
MTTEPPNPGPPYSGPPEYEVQPYPQQSYPGQPYPAQPYPQQPQSLYPAQPYPGQPYPQQPNQPGYAGPQPYGQPYGVPPYPAPYAPWLRPPPRPLDFGKIGAGIAGIGALLLVISLLVLPWYDIDGGLTSSDVHAKIADFGDVGNSFASAYHGGLAWFLLVICAAGAGLACLPRRGLSLGFRIATPIAAGLAALMTLGSSELVDPSYLSSDQDQYYLNHASWGFWLAWLR